MVSVYSIFNMVVAGISGIVGIFTSGLSASFGDVIVRNEQTVLQKAYQEFESNVLCSDKLGLFLHNGSYYAFY